jgi:hypothetical protein
VIASLHSLASETTCTACNISHLLFICWFNKLRSSPVVFVIVVIMGR